MFLRPKLPKFPSYTYNQLSPIIVRTCIHQTNTTTNPSSTWHPIYNFPSIKLLASLNRLKIYQSALTAAGVPIIMGLEMSEIVPPQTTELFGVLGITGTISLCVYSFFSTKLIGFVYVNPALKQIRFSYIDFWGKRKNQDLLLDELVYSEEKRMFDTYTVVKTKTAAGSLKLLRFGNITDPDVFHAIFGDV